MMLSTGFLGTPYLLDVLADAGHWKHVEALLLQTRYPSWGDMPATRATTMWERRNGDVGDMAMVDDDARGLSRLTLTVPPNAVTDITLPADAGWREDGSPLDGHAAIADLGSNGEFMTFSVGSGDYRFTR